MLLAITKKELERIETLIAPALVKKRYEKKVDGALLGFYCLIFSLLVIGIFRTGVILLSSLVIAFFLASPIALILIVMSKMIKKYLAKRITLSNKDIREAIIERLNSFYLPDNNIELLKTLYEKSLLKKDQKKKIERFLTINDKTIVDYLNSLGDKNLKMLAQPYREQIDKDINEAVESYFIDKSRELELQIMAENSKKSDEEKFKEDCLKFFYSTMPKNIAKHKDICSKQEKSLLELVKA